MNNDIAALAALMVSGDQQRFRLRQGQITAVASNNTCTVTIAGETDNPISEVKYASAVCPVPGASCWIATDGRDLFVVATIAPYGVAWGNMRRTTAQTINNGTFVQMDFSTEANRADIYNYGTTSSSSGITVLVPGLWAIMGSPTFVQNSGGNARYSFITVNGTRAWQGAFAAESGGGSSTYAPVPCAGTLKLQIGDVVGIQLFQNATNMNTLVGVGYGILNVRWIGPTPV